MPMTECSGPGASVSNDMASNCLSIFTSLNNTVPPGSDAAGRGLIACLRIAQEMRDQQQQNAPPPAPVYVPPADPGFHYTLITADGSHVPSYLAQGTFVKGEDALAIYAVAYESLHAFATWGQYLRAGGKADLSNVLRFPHLPAEAIGAPIPADW